MIRFVNVSTVTPASVDNHDILVDDGRIVGLLAPGEAGPDGCDSIDGGGAYAYPGMLDVLTHGFGEHLYSDAEPGGVAACSRILPKHGVTGFAPSVPSHNEQALMKMLGALADEMQSPGARALGIHSEGPCLASAGAHAPENLIHPSAELAEKMLDAAKGKLAFVTLAPELPGAEGFCRVMNRAGVGLHLGHSCAKAEDVPRFPDMGITGVTHMYDVMVAGQITEGGRYPFSLADALLAEEQLALGVICDGVHVEPMQVKLLSIAAPDRIFLETDSMKFSGLEPGNFELYPGMTVTTSLDNAARGPQGGLAGSCITSERALQKLLEYSDLDLSAASRATSLLPARLAGLEHELGSLEKGKAADIVLLDKETLEVQATYVAGKNVYQR